MQALTTTEGESGARPLIVNGVAGAQRQALPHQDCSRRRRLGPKPRVSSRSSHENSTRGGWSVRGHPQASDRSSTQPLASGPLLGVRCGCPAVGKVLAPLSVTLRVER
jgi:hypothetical protein